MKNLTSLARAGFLRVPRLPVALLTGLFLLIGCAGADIIIRNDPAPAPIDTGFHNALLETSCGPALAMGQAGCSFGHDESLDNQTLSVVSPLGGSVSIYSRECGYERRNVIAEGGRVSYRIKDMVPPGIGFCRFTIFTVWEKPPKIKTEVPVRGQSGEFFVRIRPEGTEAAHLAWTPVQGLHNEGAGILYSQFREVASPLGLDEPILLKIRPSKEVDAGKYQLFSHAKGIGIKEADFAGDEISVPRDAILGTGAKGSYALAGWAIGKGLDDDFAVIVNIFDVKNLRLAAEIEPRASEVCFKTESTVSLVVLSGVDKASNDTEGCFKRPPGRAIMAFFTNVGRAAYAVIDGDEVTWIQ